MHTNRTARDPAQLGQPTNLSKAVGSLKLYRRASLALAMALEVVDSIDLVGNQHLGSRRAVLLTLQLLCNLLRCRKVEVQVEFDILSCLVPDWLLERHLGVVSQVDL
jgi:hypothetical protein